MLTPSAAARAFNKQYSSIAGPHKSSKDTRKIVRKIRELPLEGAPVFSPEDVQEAIKQCRNSKVYGPDKLCIFHLKNLGLRGIAYLTKIFNLSLRHAQIPAIWKMSTTVPLPKPGEDLSQ
jgi:hypothetical protein